MKFKAKNEFEKCIRRVQLITKLDNLSAKHQKEIDDFEKECEELLAKHQKEIDDFEKEWKENGGRIVCEEKAVFIKVIIIILFFLGLYHYYQDQKIGSIETNIVEIETNIVEIATNTIPKIDIIPPPLNSIEFTEPNWNDRYLYWRVHYESKFKKPVKGQKISILLINGNTVNGLFQNVTTSSVSINLSNSWLTLEKNQINDKSRLEIFKDDFVEKYVKLKVNKEKNDFLSLASSINSNKVDNKVL